VAGGASRHGATPLARLDSRHHQPATRAVAAAGTTIWGRLPLSLRKFFGLEKAASAPAVETEAQFGGYAETIITNPADFDALEIQGVRDVAGEQGITEGTCYEVDNENPEFFSGCAHLVDGGVECIGDFTLLADAQGYAGVIASQYGWNVVDYTGGPSPSAFLNE
jgi:hypothetical protein